MSRWRLFRTAGVFCIAFSALAARRMSGPPCTRVATPKQNAPNGVRLRKQPTTSSDRIGAVRPRQRVRWLETRAHLDEVWLRVLIPDGTFRGKEGWMSAEYMDCVADDTIAFTARFLDVGSGDAAIINVGTTDIVIDGGPSANYLSAYLRDHHAFTGPIEIVVLSHPDADHFRGLEALFSPHHQVLQYWNGGAATSVEAAFERFARMVSRSGARSTTFDPNVIQSFVLADAPEVNFTVFRPDVVSRDAQIAFQSDNASLVLLMDIAGTKLLFTGDMVGKKEDEDAEGRPHYAERLVIDKLGPVFSQRGVDVLKVPHHGAETSSSMEFIEAFRPRFAVIPASPKEFLPADDVIKRYKNNGATVLRTDATPRRDNDHILCVRAPKQPVLCNYEYIMDE